MNISSISTGTDMQAMYGMGQRPPKPTEEEMETQVTDFISILDTDGDAFVTTGEMTTAMAELGPPPPGAGMSGGKQTSTVSQPQGAQEYKAPSNSLIDALFSAMRPDEDLEAATQTYQSSQSISLTA